MQTTQNEGLTIKGSIKLLLWVFIVQVLLTFIVYFFAGVIEGATSSPSLAFYVAKGGEILIMVFLIKRIRDKHGFKFNLFDFTSLSLYIIAALVMLGIRLVFDNSIIILLSHVEQAQWLTNTIEQIFDHPVGVIITFCIVAPIFEETLFRGIFLKQLAKRYSPTTALLLSTLFFALIHFNLHQIINTIVLGLFLGFLYLKTNSLSLCIFVHFINNLYAVLVSYGVISLGAFNGEFKLYELVSGIVLVALGSYFLQKKKDVSELKVEM